MEIGEAQLISQSCAQRVKTLVEGAQRLLGKNLHVAEAKLMMLMTGQSRLLLRKVLCWCWMSVCLNNHPGPFSSLTHIHACIQKPHLALRVSSIPLSSVHLSVLQHLFTNSKLWNGNQCLRFQFFLWCVFSDQGSSKEKPVSNPKASQAFNPSDNPCHDRFLRSWA